MMFLNENDALEIKINTCWDSVDKFIVLESSQTHTGDPKPYNLDVKRFAKYREKLIYVQMGSIDGVLKHDPRLVCGFQARSHAANHAIMGIDWVRGEAQDALLPILASQNGASDDDLLLIECCDEIISPEAISEAKEAFKNKEKFPTFVSGHDVPDPIPSIPFSINNSQAVDPIIQFWLNNYYYKANMQNPQNKTIRQSLMTTIRNAKIIKPATIRHLTIHTHKPIKNAGWHFGFLDATDGQMVLDKYKSWPHSRDTQSNYYNIATKEEAVARLAREMKIEKVPISYETHPKYLVDNLDKYQHIIQHPVL